MRFRHGDSSSLQDPEGRLLVPAAYPQVPEIAYRNFNLCPHRAFNGQQALLCRLCEGLPMISRSEGETFHLLLADQPLPYPIEVTAGTTRQVSLRFWYSHVRNSRKPCPPLSSSRLHAPTIPPFFAGSKRSPTSLRKNSCAEVALQASTNYLRTLLPWLRPKPCRCFRMDRIPRNSACL